MPRKAKGPRLYWRKPRNDRPGVWVIRDGQIQRSTGTFDIGQAEERLETYIAQKRSRPSGVSEELTIPQALEIYGEEHAPTVADPARIGYAIDALLSFWSGMSTRDVTGATCRRYAKERQRAAATVRRELGVLQAATNHCVAEGYLRSAPKVSLPDVEQTKDRWLTRDEMALLLRSARKLNKDGRHLTRFILAGRYTGTRKSAILALKIDVPSPQAGHIDTTTGILHRAGSSERRTKKRRGRAKAPRQFVAHCRRWKANGALHVVERQMMVKGKLTRSAVTNVVKGWSRMLEIAAKADPSFDPSDVTPHVLRHTAITWAMQSGARDADVCSYFDVSLQTLQKHYWHHHPDFQKTAVEALESRISGTVSGTRGFAK